MIGRPLPAHCGTCFRVHSMTWEKPVNRLQRELEFLRQVTQEPYAVAFEETRAVSWSSTVSFRGARYSVPHRHTGARRETTGTTSRIAHRCASDGPLEFPLLAGHAWPSDVVRNASDLHNVRGAQTAALLPRRRSPPCRRPPHSRLRQPASQFATSADGHCSRYSSSLGRLDTVRSSTEARPIAESAMTPSSSSSPAALSTR